MMIIGILLGSGQALVEQRKFAIRNLRDFGFGGTSMEDIIMEEVKELLDWIKEKTGQPITLNRRLKLATFNALWRILSGERYEHDDPHLTEMVENYELYVLLKSVEYTAVTGTGDLKVPLH